MIINRQWCMPNKNTFDIKTGKSFYELGNNAIYSDTNNLQASLNEMKTLMNNKDLYEERRNNMYKLVKQNYCSTENIKIFYGTILKIANKT